MRKWAGSIAILLGGLVLAGSVWADDAPPAEAKKPAKDHPVAAGSFLEKFLAPKISSRLTTDAVAITNFADPNANPWVRDTQLVGRVEKGTVSAAMGAAKQYVLHSLQLDTMTIPISAGSSGLLGGSNETMRLRFGISHMTPRADLMIPSSHGHIRLSADVRGSFATGYETEGSRFGVDVSVDPLRHQATFGLARRF